MLLAWMAYSVLFGALVYAAALAADRASATWNRAQRFVWVVAILGVTALPLVFATRRAPRLDLIGDISTASSLDVDIPVGALHKSQEKTSRPDLSTRIAPVVAAAEPYISRASLVTSLGCFVLLLRAVVAVRRQRSRWRAVDLNGTRVLVAEQTGPAVVGVLAPAVVIPQWALALDGAGAIADAATRSRAHSRARSAAALRRGCRDHALPVERRTLASRATAPPRDRDRLRPARSARHAGAPRVRIAAADGRRTPCRPAAIAWLAQRRRDLALARVGVAVLKSRHRSASQASSLQPRAPRS